MQRAVPCPMNKGVSYTNLVFGLDVILKLDYYYHYLIWGGYRACYWKTCGRWRGPHIWHNMLLYLFFSLFFGDYFSRLNLQRVSSFYFYIFVEGTLVETFLTILGYTHTHNLMEFWNGKNPNSCSSPFISLGRWTNFYFRILSIYILMQCSV